jgi:long-subunit fatty acid transport protein
MSETNKELTVFLDNVGRTIIGKIVKQDDAILTIENPALVHIEANKQTNQLQLQILPLFFKEFQADKSQPTVWNFKKANITSSDSIPFAVQFTAQYEQLFNVAPPAPKEPKIVKLFEDEE